MQPIYVGSVQMAQTPKSLASTNTYRKENRKNLIKKWKRNREWQIPKANKKRSSGKWVNHVILLKVYLIPA